MRLDSYRTFHRAIQRIRLLYEVTVHSYNLMYNDGRVRLRDPAEREAKVEITLAAKVVKRPLKVLTFHAKDVYPQLLRSTLLIRLVAAFEAFLVDTIEEVAERSDGPFESDTRLELSYRQLLAMEREHSVKSHLVRRTTRQLTSGGFKEIKKFYQSTLKVQIAPSGMSGQVLDEIHDRRHLYVHRSGYADGQYIHDYPGSAARVNELIPVEEAYLLDALDSLSATALHVKTQVEAKYPELPAWRYRIGQQTIAASRDQVVMVYARTPDPNKVPGLLDLSEPLSASSTVGSVVIWVATKGTSARWLVGGSRNDLSSFFRLLASLEDGGLVANVDSFKINRDTA